MILSEQYVTIEYSEKTVPFNRLRITLTANGRNDHVAMFIPHLWLAVFIFSAKLDSFALAPRATIILHHSHPCTSFFEKT